MDPTIAQTLMGYAQPARPVSPTPMTRDDLANALYGSALPSALPLAPLPSWLPPNVQNYINQAPSYEEGQRQTLTPPSITRGGEPYDPTPQLDDINRLFFSSIMRNAATSNPTRGKFLRDITLSGHLGGGDEI